MDTLPRELRHAARRLARAPGYTLVAVATLALALGVNSALFAVLRAVVLRPPPFADPERVVVFHGVRHGETQGPGSSSQPDYEDWRDGPPVFEAVATLAYWTYNLTGRELPERLVGARVTGSFFEVLGTPALLGRTVVPADDRPGAPDVAVLSYPLWRGLFQADPGIVGRTLVLNGVPVTVVGVMPRGFTFPREDVTLWGAVSSNMGGMTRDGRFLTTVARIRDGVTLAQAQAAVDVTSLRLQREHPDTNTGWTTRLVTAHETRVGGLRPVLLLMQGAVAFVLLIASANVAHLVLARAAARRRESAVRAALGAGRWPLVRGFLLECLLLAAAGGCCGLALAAAAVGGLRRLAPPETPRLDEVALDAPVFLFTLAVTAAVGALLGILPALQTARADLGPALAEGARGTVSRGAGPRLRAGLLVAQVGLALMVLVGGGLLLRSLSRLLAVDPGFEPRGVLSLKVFLGPPRYRLLPSQHGYVRDALARLEQLPGVSSVAAVSHLPLGGLTSRQRFEVEGRPAPAGEAPSASYRAVSASYFRTLRIPLRRGRELGEGDTGDSPPVLVVNESMARRCWPGEDPLGRRVRWMGGPDPRWLTVVGVVADVRSEGLHASEGLVAYAPYTQRRFPWLRWTSFAVRTDGDPLALAGAVRAALARLDPEQPVYEVASLEEVVSRSLAERRFHALTLQAFAALGLALAAIGVYGVVAYDVRERTAEIGLRMALGAQKGDVLRLVLRQGLLLALAGVALGTAGAVAAARALAPMLFEVTATDPLTYAGMAGLLVASALVASAVPAARAARLDPLQALR